ncbi:Fis family transcriptional regulator [Chromatium okenii]|uniref:SoxR reducing system RseC family protein n=1 Tax=Chromatium okenii TaxID=61644 RepID=UPI001908F858|nr:SoxR reducing system RseC family protein [Chromatium okenii]MBK1641927.1 Fis family transcriptional regulator [Chromatium okenii]
MPLSNVPPDDSPDLLQPELIEGLARVVAVEGELVWLEPETTTTCGGCAASGLCGATGIGTTARRLQFRRFSLINTPQLVVGERIVVGVDGRALLKASGTAYALPLLIMFGAGGVAQSSVGSDGVTMAAMVSGLAIGLLAARWGAQWLGSRGQLAPRFLRRVDCDATSQFVTLES